MDLNNLPKQTTKPARILIHGTEGIGKTTFGFCAPSPLFLQVEDGAGQLDLTGIKTPTYAATIEVLEALATQDHAFKTVVIDTIDRLEEEVHKETCRRHEKKSIEAFGFGRGYVEAGYVWREILNLLDYLRDEKGMTILLVAHTTPTRINDPMHDAYDSWSPRMHKKIVGEIVAWCDVVGFAEVERFTKKEDTGFKTTRTRVITKGERILHLEGNAAFVAKNRYSMPAALPLDWNAFAEHLPSNDTKEE